MRGASWTLPTGWIRGNGFSAADFVRICNAFYVRLLAQMNRTPAERDAVNWGTVISRVDAGLQPGMGGLRGVDGDFWMDGDATEVWAHQMNYFGSQSSNSTWARADYKTIGWTDQSTGYSNWLATPVADRREFPMNAADARIHPPGDGLGVGLDFQYQGASIFRPERGYYHFSMYQYYRYGEYANGDQSAPWPMILYEAQQLYKAEGLFRTGDFAGAAAIVNNTRVTRGNLPAATAGDADLYEKIIYEHLIENFNHCTGCAYYNRRGWGPLSSTQQHHWGLVEGSPRHWAIPGSELEVLQKLNYTFGGLGTEGGSLASVGGSAADMVTAVPARMVYAFNGLDSVKQKLDYIWRKDDRIPAGVRSLIRH
jgi:hypothetical protein